MFKPIQFNHHSFRSFYLRFLFLIFISIVPLIFAAVTRNILISYTLSVFLFCGIYFLLSGVYPRIKYIIKERKYRLEVAKLELYQEVILENKLTSHGRLEATDEILDLLIVLRSQVTDPINKKEIDKVILELTSLHSLKNLKKDRAKKLLDFMASIIMHKMTENISTILEEQTSGDEK